MINANMLAKHIIGHVPAGDTERLLLDVVSRVKIPAMKQFLETVMQEPEIRQALTVPARISMSASFNDCAYPVLALRRAGELAACWCACGGEERDVLFVATLLQGTQKLLEPVVLGSSTVEDVMFTLVRRSLHRLDDQAPRCSRLLRLALGWGCDDEIDDYYVPRLQIAVHRTLTQVGFSSGRTATEIRSHQRNDKRSHNGRPQLSSMKDTEPCQA